MYAGNVWERARTVLLKRASDSELSARKNAAGTWIEGINQDGEDLEKVRDQYPFLHKDLGM